MNCCYKVVLGVRGQRMARSDAATVQEYLEELPSERRDTVATVRDVVLANLPDGYVEAMNWGMICWEVPLETYPNTYNKKPLMYAALGAQKNYVSLYLMGVYSDEDGGASFEERYRGSGKRLNMGKSCVRFKTADDLPMELIAETIAAIPVGEYVKRYEAARKK